MSPKRLFSAIAVVLLGLTSFGLYWGWQLYRPLQLPEPRPPQLSVYSGETLGALLFRLQMEGWQLPAAQLSLYARFHRLDRAVRSGDYLLEDCCPTALSLLTLLTSGQQLTHRVTLVEGWDFRQMRETLAAQSKLVSRLSADHAEAARQLGIGYESPEGLFHPETYAYATGESDIDVLKRARRRQRELVADLWSRRDPDLPYETPYEAIVLASIVEREARKRFEAPRIAGVYVSRLRKGWRLEADPTVIYGLGNDYGTPLTLTDLRTDTPWNTYMRSGLPPTPIAAPGEEALRAALAPEEDGMMYFVARGDGSHVFSTTLAEHRRNVRQVRAARRRAQAEEASSSQ